MKLLIVMVLCLGVVSCVGPFNHICSFDEQGCVE